MWLHVPRNWLSTVARPDHVVIAGYPVLAACGHDEQGRPTRLRVAVIGGFFDDSMHGWRAHGMTHLAELTWPDDQPLIQVGDPIS